DKTLHVAERKGISDLRPDPENARPESAKNGVLAGGVGKLLIGVAGNADEKLLGEKVGDTPVEMEVDAVLVLRIGIFEIVGEAGGRRELVAGRRIEIRVGAAGVERAM